MQKPFSIQICHFDFVHAVCRSILLSIWLLIIHWIIFIVDSNIFDSVFVSCTQNAATQIILSGWDIINTNIIRLQWPAGCSRGFVVILFLLWVSSRLNATEACCCPTQVLYRSMNGPLLPETALHLNEKYKSLNEILSQQLLVTESNPAFWVGKPENTTQKIRIDK